MADPIRPAIGLPPTETVEFFRAKGVTVLTSHWLDLWQEEHTRARTVAGLNDLAILNRVYDELDTVLSEGGTFEMFRQSLAADLQSAVAEGRAPDRLLTDRGLRTVYDTNLRMARAAGQWTRIQKAKRATPYLLYSAIDDDRTRPEHRLWGGLDGGRPICLPVDHPAWRYVFPPNGWGCRCNVIQLAAADFEAFGVRLTTEAELRGMGLPTADDPDTFEVTPFERDGDLQPIPVGVDPGFAYNVGESHMAGLAQALTSNLEALAPRNAALAQNLLQSIVDETVFTTFLEQSGAAYPVMVLGDGNRALIGAKTAVVRLSADSFAKQLREHPEIKLDEYRKLVALGAAPEIILKQGDVRIVLIKAEGNKWLKATVKVTRDGSELYLVNYQFADRREVNRLKRLNEIVRDDG